PDESVVGSVAKRIKLGKAVFALTDASGSDIGEIRAENWRAKDFSVTDHIGNEVARTTKKWRGMATEMFTDADTYVVTVQPHVNEPLRSLAVAAALAIDVVMKQAD
ncbi:MAG TPA: phospholipid scramblase-related protein, partial [Acidimicrobiia bacterium]|nr:phospholipid scramblase-related protein [Acidimicrobiia bacterium]